MRKIKFRQPIIIKGKFQEFHYWGYIEDGIFCGPATRTTIKGDQYTGLKDKNGVEIYEGDIIYLAGYGKYEVEFPFTELYEAGSEGDIGEIKGNIYENPELLNNK